MITKNYEGKFVLYYHDKQHIKDAYQWFDDMRNEPPCEIANLLKDLYGYEEIIICMAYTWFVRNIPLKQMNFNDIAKETTFINPFMYK